MINQIQSVLIVVDMQNDFMPQGVLAIEQADQIIPTINRLAQYFDNVVLTQDWHPKQHISFADNHQNRVPFSDIKLGYGSQVLWPSHCVQGSYGADFHPELSIPHTQLIIRKGYHVHIDSYSAFMEADRHTPTGLTSYLKERGINTVYIVGIATDFCVKWTALDAIKLGFRSIVIADLCKAIDLNHSLDQAWQEMFSVGVERIESTDILNPLL